MLEEDADSEGVSDTDAVTVDVRDLVVEYVPASAAELRALDDADAASGDVDAKDVAEPGAALLEAPTLCVTPSLAEAGRAVRVNERERDGVDGAELDADADGDDVA